MRVAGRALDSTPPLPSTSLHSIMLLVLSTPCCAASDISASFTVMPLIPVGSIPNSMPPPAVAAGAGAGASSGSGSRGGAGAGTCAGAHADADADADVDEGAGADDRAKKFSRSPPDLARFLGGIVRTERCSSAAWAVCAKASERRKALQALSFRRSVVEPARL